MFYCDFFIMGFLRMKEYWPSFLRISLTWVFLFFVLNGAGGSQWFGCYFFCPPLLIAPYTYINSVRFSSVAHSCLTLCDPMNHSTPHKREGTGDWKGLNDGQWPKSWKRGPAVWNWVVSGSWVLQWQYRLRSQVVSESWWNILMTVGHTRLRDQGRRRKISTTWKGGRR